MAFVTQFLDRSPALDGPADPAGSVDPDAALVARWQQGDEAAFADLVRRHERRVFGLLVRMLGSRDEAQDAAQDAFLNLHRHGRRFRRESRFSTFVYRVAVNAALNRRRGQGRRRAHLRSLEERQASGHDLPVSPRGPEDAAYGGQVRERVQEAIGGLSEPLRAPLVLYDLEGL
ncbi:MAG: RNA polymerase sigma factor, partial [Myxococcota bacterium]|nr:RNA polymerase sigma factor [Myxococcota bacterium]